MLKKTTIPQVKAKVPVLKEITEDEFWDKASILNFAVTDGHMHVYTNLADEVLERTEDKIFELDYDLKDYKIKVNRYIEENKNNIAIHKLRNNIPLNEADFKTLEKIFIGELGTKQDYESNFKDTPFGLLVRRIAKLNLPNHPLINRKALLSYLILISRKGSFK